MSAKSLLQKIKSVFGLGGGSDESPDESDAGVTIEREPGSDSTPTASDESAPADATGPPTHDQEAETVTDSPTADATATTDDGPDTGTAPDSSDAGAGTEDPESPASGEPTDTVKGIGPTYSDRLADAGIETVDQLAEADAGAVADAAQTGETKAGNWIERARNRRS